MSADKQLKSYIDRVLRLKEEQDTLGDDIREVYAEAKSEGYDKTIMGKLVAHLRKVAKSGEDAVSEQEMNFDTYLQAYHRASGTAVATHTHEEKSERIDPLTGEFLDDAPVTIIDQTDRDGHHIKVTVDPQIATILARVEAKRSAAGLDIDGSVAAKEHRSDAGLDIVTKHTEIATASQGEAAAPSAEVETSGANEGGDNVESSGLPAGLEGGPVNLEPSGPEAERATNSPETANEMDRDTEGSLEAGSATAENARKATATVAEPDSVTHAEAGESPAPSFLTKPPSPLRPHCQRPEMCAGVGRTHCHTCSKAMREQEEFA